MRRPMRDGGLHHGQILLALASLLQRRVASAAASPTGVSCRPPWRWQLMPAALRMSKHAYDATMI